MSPKKKLKLKKNQPNESPEKCLSLEVPNENIPIKLPYQQEHEISSKKAAKRKKKDCKFLTFKPCKGKHHINVSIKVNKKFLSNFQRYFKFTIS